MKKVLLSVLICNCYFLGIAQFQAKMNNSMSGKERTYTVYSDLNQYRYDFEEDGKKGIVIVNPAANQTAILMPDKKFVHRTTCDGMMSRMNDPVQSYEVYKKYGPEKEIGKESIDGYECLTREINQGDTRVFTAWYSEKLKFPLKILAHYAENTYMKLTEIQKWKPDPSYFLIPDDFTEVDEQMRPIIPEPPPPETWDLKEVNIPFEGTLSRGNKIKMVIPQTVYYKFIALNNGNTPAKFTYHLYENGEKIPWDIVGNDDRRTHRLYMEEKKNQTMDWKEGWVLVIEVYEGELNLKVYPE